jgi:hypothetical protein
MAPVNQIGMEVGGGCQLCYRQEWRDEERKNGMSGLDKSLEVLEKMMNSICWFLNLTMESVKDFEGVLPTLDLIIWVRAEDNKTMYSFYQKPMASNMVIQKVSTMPENMRMSTLNQEMTRRMMNTNEMVPMEQRITVVDDYGQKLTDSGYGIEQIRRVVVGGLTGYDRALHLCKDTTNSRWRPLHKSACFNATKRRNKKLMAKSNWFKRKADDDSEGNSSASSSSSSPAKRMRQDEGARNQNINVEIVATQKTQTQFPNNSQTKPREKSPRQYLYYLLTKL